jgi:Ni,Fe-hydrogenase I large subunit
MTRVVIDPVTRVTGHLRLEAVVDGGSVQDALLSGTMYRGIEAILRGRDPRDAWLLAQRVCGACTGVHALASVRAVENALNVTVPRNAQLLRNLICGATTLQEDVIGFYVRQAADWLDPGAALTASPTATATLAQWMSDWPKSDASYFSSASDRIRVMSQSGRLASAYSGHPAYRASPELSLIVFAHYLEALEWQREIVRMRTILGGKSPHPQTYLVGGMAMAPEWGGPVRPVQGEHPWRAARHSPPPLSDYGLADIEQIINDSLKFVSDVFVPDVLALADLYRDWQSIGRGYGHYLSYGEYPQEVIPPQPLFLPRGRVMDADISRVYEVDQAGVAETVEHSWYGYSSTDGALLHPGLGETRPGYAGPALPYTSLEGWTKYSWLKAPRYEDDPMEVGPLARMLVAYAAGATSVAGAVDRAVFRLGPGMDGMHSAMGRIVARAIESELLAVRLSGWLTDLRSNMANGDLAIADLAGWDPSTWPAEASGWGLTEGPRGAVGHWLTIRDKRIADYQIVDASTWNGSPRDERGRRGACEQALVLTPVADPNRPLEVLRTVHAFDVCPACAVH